MPQEQDGEKSQHAFYTQHGHPFEEMLSSSEQVELFEGDPDRAGDEDIAQVLLTYRATDGRIIADGEAELLEAPDQVQGGLAHEPQGTRDERGIAGKRQSSHVELVVVIGVQATRSPPVGPGPT